MILVFNISILNTSVDLACYKIAVSTVAYNFNESTSYTEAAIILVFNISILNTNVELEDTKNYSSIQRE
jgi:hypothetical protein